MTNSHSRLYVGPTVLFIDAWCQQDSHVIVWRSWLWYVRGIHVDKHGRKWNRRGEPV